MVSTVRYGMMEGMGMGGLRFGAEFIFFEGGHESGGEAKGSQAEAALGASTDVIDDSDCSFVKFFLIVVLVFDCIEVDKIAQIGRSIPADIVCIDINLSQLLDHLILVCAI